MRLNYLSTQFAVVTLTCVVWPLANLRAVQDEPVMTDETITDKIDDELLYDQGVVSTKVDVSTTDGIVTLTGEVDNILAKERAARIAEAIKGVRSVVNRIEVSPAKIRSDTQIQRDIESALLQDPATESYEITVVVQGGEATLTGVVDSYQERELVKKVAKGVQGVAGIDDQISIDYKSERPDGEIREEIEQALRWNAHVDHELIDVGVKDGVVTLSGTVGSAAEKRMASYDGWVAGVSSVDTSKLTVAKWARDEQMRGDKYVIKSDAELEDAINDALLYDPRVMSFNVDVDVVGSTVTLRGDVSNLKAKRAAERDAKNTVGVETVNNRLKVRYDGTSIDAEIAEDVRDALLRDPYVERFEITVNVVGGTAHLYGSVDSYFERNRADDVAARTLGVLDVENHLTVHDSVAYLFDPYVDDTYVEADELYDYEPRAPLKSDYEIKESIESQLWWSPFVDSDEVSVAVDDGIATLTGTVETWGEQQSATENAYEGGATLVDNDLVVNYGS